MDGGESYKEVTEVDLTQVPLHTLTTHTLLYFMERERETDRQREAFYLMTLSIAKIVWHMRQTNTIREWSTDRMRPAGVEQRTGRETYSCAN